MPKSIPDSPPKNSFSYRDSNGTLIMQHYSTKVAMLAPDNRLHIDLSIASPTTKRVINYFLNKVLGVSAQVSTAGNTYKVGKIESKEPVFSAPLTAL